MTARALGIAAIAVAGFGLLHKRAFAADGELLTLEGVQGYAESTVRSYDFDFDWKMIPRIAWIESSNRSTTRENVRFNPAAIRPEPQIGDASIGLMQTLLGTAQWLARDMGFSAFGIPTTAALLSPWESVYFGASYLQYLHRYAGKRRSIEFMVRSYNGGPGHSQGATNGYWQHYKKAREVVG